MLEHFLSRRLLKKNDSKTTRPIVTLSIIGISICLIIIILSLSITTGYRKAIEQKVIDMGSHIRISNYDQNYTFDAKPFSKNQPFLSDLKKNPDIRHIQYFSTKVGIVKTDNQVEGMVLKGIDSSFSWKLFEHNMVEGEPLDLRSDTLSNGVVMSESMAKKLNLKVGDKVFAYFVQNPPMARRFYLSAIYRTGMPEYDDRFVFGDLRHVQKLCGWGHSYDVVKPNGDTVQGWQSDSVGGIEILLNDYNKIDEVGDFVNHHISYDLKAETIKQVYPAIFQWTELFDANVIVLLIITIFICVITLISTFFIIILEQTSTIGILKSMGMTTQRIRNVFLHVGLRIILIGMFMGNVTGIALCLLQKYAHIVKLDPSSYYVPYVPIDFNIPQIIIVNICVLIICLLVLLIPATFVSKKISAVSAIRFE